MAFQQVQTVYAGGAGPFSTTAVTFDPLEELVWTANTGGYISSHHSTELAKYSSYATTHEPVAGLAALASGILSVGSNAVRLHSRQGVCHYTVKNENFEHLVCLTESQSGSAAWVSGGQSISALDISTGTITNTGACSSDHIVLRNNQDRFICAGTSSGKVILHDPSSLRVVHSMDPHGGTINDIDVAGNTLVTCGWSQRAMERHLMVYDLRMLKSMVPYQLPIAPCVVRFVPAYSTSLLALDQTGTFLVCNPNGASSVDAMAQYELPLDSQVAYYTAAFSSNSHYLAFGDTSGSIHLWADAADQQFNNYSRPCVMADERPELPAIDSNSLSTPFSAVPMPWVNGPLLSDMPEETYEYRPRQDPAIDPAILQSMKIVDFVGYAPNPHKRVRNQMPYENEAKALENRKHTRISAALKSPMNRAETEFLKLIPKCYRPVKLRYSRLGLADFDFKQYNHTSFSGLEINIPNAYCNSMLQVFYFLEPLKISMQNHFCEKNACLACELGFLFNMLDVSKSEPCQASNFLRAFRCLPEAGAMGLLFKKDVDASTQLSEIIQRWSRFVLQQLVNDTEPRQPESMQFPPLPQRASIVNKLFTAAFQTYITCKECGSEENKPYTTLQWSVTYPRARLDDPSASSSSTSGTSSRPVPRTFSEVLCGSILREQATQSFCQTCKKHQPSRQIRTLRRMPHVLCINCQADSPSEQEFWRQQQQLVLEELETNRGTAGPHGQQLLWKSWLPTSLRISQKGDDLRVEDCSTLDGPQDQRFQSPKSDIYYDLISSVAYVKDTQSPGALVAHIKVSSNYHRKKENVDQTQWYIFNDFAVNPVAQDSAVDFADAWKVPCVLFYARRDLNHLYDLSVRQHQNPNVLVAALPRANPALSQVVPPVRVLQVDELPQRRALFGLDAEFVVLNQEEAELAIDGTKTTIKPSCLSLARITAVRGGNKLHGVPFIDDHIATTEPVVDYLTKYSGIKPGDLDPNVSSKHLVTLKQAYRKLKFLVDCGVCFVGHGLKSDFRVINMLIPAEQVLDTVELFHLPNQRYISLKFLAWFFLNVHIQLVVHDSIEDALTAVTLYRRYVHLRRQNQLTDAIKKLYEAGRKHNWQVPPVKP
eukprot:scpid24822/ scgid28493/ PAB-dependent poly(A)-specific ribonuclease subunit 2; Inactive ubiquitin carboxyl-terminal hydrolase 52